VKDKYGNMKWNTKEDAVAASEWFLHGKKTGDA